MTYIYNEELKFLLGLNYKYEDFIIDPKLYYPMWKDNYFCSSSKIEYPIKGENGLREMTREEKILYLGMHELLIDGEIIKEGKIVAVTCPDGFITKRWNSIKKCWEEGANRNDLIIERKNKILEYGKIKAEIEELKILSGEFESDEAVKLLEGKLLNLKNKINELGVKIKKLKGDE